MVCEGGGVGWLSHVCVCGKAQLGPAPFGCSSGSVCALCPVNSGVRCAVSLSATTAAAAAATAVVGTGTGVEGGMVACAANQP